MKPTRLVFYCLLYITLLKGVVYPQIHKKIQVGLASWYGKEFNNRPTSSGEPYNMFLLTAAHRTLPLGTFVKVTNLRNKLSVIVRINDRGPVPNNRVIDVSYAAKVILGMRDLERVKIERID